jgi:L-ribulose-5-phosphate 3-epimerase
MLLGYNTNGLAHHDPLAAVELLAELGYRSVALTLDHGLLNPYRSDLPQRLAEMRAALSRHQMRSVVETGARFLLDARHKHEPTLVSADAAGRARRVDFLCRAIDIAANLGSDCVSLWSGTLHHDAGEEAAFSRLVAGLGKVLDYAQRRQVTLGFEPEPGMLIDTMARYEELVSRLDHPQLRLTLDIGHLQCLGETPLAAQIERWGERLVNVHIEDMRAGVHEHLMFGEGEIDFPPVIAALRKVGYRGGRRWGLHGYGGSVPHAARRAMEFLRPLLTE